MTKNLDTFFKGEALFFGLSLFGYKIDYPDGFNYFHSGPFVAFVALSFVFIILLLHLQKRI